MSAPLPLGEQVPTADQRIVMGGVPWSHFEVQLALRGDRAGPHFFYLAGALEIMSPSFNHENIGFRLAHLIATYCLEKDLEFQGAGSWTLKSEPKQAGAEPDECFIVGDQRKERPDLAIEVIWTSGGIDKLEIYRRLGVGEVWVWEEGRLEVHVLENDRFVPRERSRLFPELDLALLTSFLASPTDSQAIRGYRDALRK